MGTATDAQGPGQALGFGQFGDQLRLVLAAAQQLAQLRCCSLLVAELCELLDLLGSELHSTWR